MTARMLTIKQVCERVGLARPTIYAMMQKGAFPRGRKLTAAAVRWCSREVEEWLENRPRSAGIERPAA